MSNFDLSYERLNNWWRRVSKTTPKELRARAKRGTIIHSPYTNRPNLRLPGNVRLNNRGRLSGGSIYELLSKKIK